MKMNKIPVFSSFPGNIQYYQYSNPVLRVLTNIFRRLAHKPNDLSTTSPQIAYTNSAELEALPLIPKDDNINGCSIKKRITVLVCDIVASTTIAEESEPEELQHIIYSYHDYCREIIHKQGGTVTRYMGDDVLAYFEDDLNSGSCAGFAVNAASELLSNMDTLNRRINYTLKIRIGISTGIAMITNNRKDQPAVGKPLHIAARLQEISQSNRVIVCNLTRTLAKKYHHFNRLPIIPVKGFTGDIVSWELGI